MAVDSVLALRRIRPRLRPAGLPAANPHRREKRALARERQITPRRAARILKAARRG